MSCARGAEVGVVVVSVVVVAGAVSCARVVVAGVVSCVVVAGAVSCARVVVAGVGARVVAVIAGGVARGSTVAQAPGAESLRVRLCDSSALARMIVGDPAWP